MDNCWYNFGDAVRLAAQGEVVQRLLLHVGQDVVEEAARLERTVAAGRVAHEFQPPAARGKPVDRLFVVQRGEADLLEVVGALREPGRLAGRLHRRQQQRDQDADDRDDHQQLDQA